MSHKSNSLMYDLKTNSQFQQAMREAQIRGPENPLFKGATAIWDNVVIHEHERIALKTSSDTNWSTNGATCFLLGQQALVWGWGQRPKMVTKMFDYDDEIGHAWGMIAGVAAPYFSWSGTNYRNGSFIVPVARTAVSDA